jgi:hypothetical protein
MHLSQIIDAHGEHIESRHLHLSELDSFVDSHRFFHVGRMGADWMEITWFLLYVQYIQPFDKTKNHFLLNDRLLVRHYRGKGRHVMAWVSFDAQGKPIGGASYVVNDHLTFLNAIVMELALS